MKSTVAAVILCTILFLPSGGRAGSAIDDVRAQITAWRASWQAGDIATYAGHYHPAFRSGDRGLYEWIENKRAVFLGSGPFSVEIFGLSVFVEEGQAIARFVQRYRGGNYKDVGEKTLVLEKLNGVWKIISEEWRSAPRGTRLPGEPKEPGPKPQPPVTGTGQPSFPAVRDMTQSLRFEIGPDGQENVYVQLNRFFIPTIFDLGGESPRIVIDIQDVSDWGGEPKISVDGRMIRQIRSSLHRDEKKLRIVLDLEPADNYSVSQTYFRKENVYCVGVRP